MYKPVGILNKHEFDAKFGHYTTNFNINVNYNDVFYDLNDENHVCVNENGQNNDNLDYLCSP